MDDLDFLRAYNGEGEEPTKEGESPAAAPEGEEKKEGLALKQQPPGVEPKKGSGMKMSVPGSFALLLGFILLLVFAVSPAYPEASYTRLQLLLSVILKGGSLKPEAVSGLQPYASMPGNGTEGTDYHIGGLMSSGSLYSGEVPTYG